MNTAPQFRVTPTSEYEDKAPGFVIEALFWPIGYDAPFYAIADWDERSIPDFTGVFPTRAAAEAAIADRLCA